MRFTAVCAEITLSLNFSSRESPRLENESATRDSRSLCERWLQRQRVDCTRSLFLGEFWLKQSNVDWRLNFSNYHHLNCGLFWWTTANKNERNKNSKFCGPCDQFTHFRGRLYCRQSDRKSLKREWWESKKFTACLWRCGQFLCCCVLLEAQTRHEFKDV